MRFPGILVIGATGRIGDVLRRSWPGGGVRWQTRRAAPGDGWTRVDPLAEPAALARAAQGCSVILNLAGPAPGRGGDMADHAALAEAAVRAGAASGARVLLASSAAVYGRAAGELTEAAPLHPVSDYGRAKVEMEARAAARAAELGVAVTALRIGNVAGLDAALGGWRPGCALDRFADGATPARSYVGPVTLARLLAALCAAPDLPAVLNVAAPGAVEMGALLDAAGLAWTARPAPAGAIPRVQLSVAALARLCPLEPVDPAAMVAEWRGLEPHMGGVAR
ncbi:Nucleoside-diphosphate-sugar epimerase [Cribrihabitans marinus]|uniref:Nucleoside-diphosphate-sugar epimerase n=2 Tax=Cribrihabitans marinus TaxID=1227549 RepID=A0A1H7E338_9RHOB|nr:NAD-dependent epimerase/dehydratase family protein [Cribrihabitans marinus]GGH41053.1 epimerase [Cribrihabitans marinus]SEK06442.1 Nucleoside-diphosphate-sugar epimerase [Cribrihabitans marinus]